MREEGNERSKIERERTNDKRKERDSDKTKRGETRGEQNKVIEK